MKTKILTGVQQALTNVAQSFDIPAESLHIPLELERCKDPNHGDFAVNAAMKYAKIFKMNPRQLAEKIITAMPEIEGIAGFETAGPGFINIRLSAAGSTAVLEDIVREGEHFGRQSPSVAEKILLEYVSANPTGPLHVGHGRGAAYGDTLANVLRANGHQVDCEYYVNDAGRQMDILALSVYWRYMQLCGSETRLPQGLYQGDYVIGVAEQLKQQAGDSLYHQPDTWLPAFPEADTDNDSTQRDRWIDATIAALKSVLGNDGYQQVFHAGLDAEVEDIRQDLAAFGVRFSRWYSERSLFANARVEQVLQVLQEKGFIYEKDGALWFKATQFGDEKDRVVRRENGITTYFASDIAYHFDKYERGYDLMIDIFGADHHGYMARVRASLAGLGLSPEKLTIALVQFAVLYKNGEKVQMSTRSGQFVTLRELRRQVGSDAARFFYVMRKPEQHLDFDLDLAVSHSKDNPYYYVQYAHARTCRMLERAKEEHIDFNAFDALDKCSYLTEETEKLVIRTLARYPEVIIASGQQLAGHLVVNYLKELAAIWHQYYDAGHKVLHENPEIRDARLLMTYCVRQVLRNGLGIIGVAAKDRM